MFADLKARLRALIRHSTVERELDAELQFHLERQIEQFMNAGLDREEARRRARVVFGGLDQIKEECRDARGTRFVEELWRDVHYGVRMMRRRALSSVAAIATVAVGIGVNAAVFSLVDWVLLRPLPYPSPDELVKVHPLARGAAPTPGNLTHAEFERASMSASFASSVAVTTSSRVLSAPGIEPAHIVVGRISGDLFRTFGVSPVLGRAITAAEIAGGLSAAVISDDLWRQRFLADPNAMTRVVTLDGRPHTIVGVMPAKRGYPSDVDLWRPITGDEREDNDREYVMIARLAGGATVQRANVEYVSTEQTPLGGGVLLIRTRGSVQTIVPQLRERLRSAAPALPLDRIHDVSQLLAADGTPTRFNMTLASAFALLAVILAAIGVYALTAGEVIARWRELAVRLALGATRHEAFWTIIGPSVTAVSIGVVIGIAASFVTARWIQSLLHGVGPADPVTFIAAPILLVIVGLTGATAAALKVLKADPATTLRAE
jgi:putative ABC transport system permease protein